MLLASTVIHHNYVQVLKQQLNYMYLLYKIFIIYMYIIFIINIRIYYMYSIMLKVARNIYHFRKISAQMIKTKQSNK